MFNQVWPYGPVPPPKGIVDPSTLLAWVQSHTMSVVLMLDCDGQWVARVAMINRDSIISRGATPLIALANAKEMAP